LNSQNSSKSSEKSTGIAVELSNEVVNSGSDGK